MPTRWLFRASEGMLAQKLVTLASTLLLLQRQLGYTPTKLRDYGVASRGCCPGVALTPLPEHQHLHLVQNQQDNKVYPFLALVNIVRENNSTDVMNMNDNLPDVEECDSEQEEYAMDCESD